VNLFTLPPTAPFLDAIAAEWLERAGDDPMRVAEGIIILPTRRAARSLAERFAARAGRALLLPRIVGIGALDEAPLALAGALDLPPAVDPARRCAVLSRMILAMRGAEGAPTTADRAWPLAAELAALMDEAERAGIDLADALPSAADPAFAAHWARTLEFLHIVTRAWPDWLAEQGLMNPAARQVALLHAQAEAWERAPPEMRVLAAGMTGGIPAVARLLGAVALAPSGAVLLPGLDRTLDHALDESHPQAGMRRLLAAIGARCEDVADWPMSLPRRVPPGRADLFRHALLPAAALEAWRSETAALDTDGLARLAPADQQEDAAAIALVLREALETPEARAALVTPDRDLAGRVAAELLRYGIVADDSAGRPLAETPPAVFLRLLAGAVEERLSPVPLLALLKHPLAAAGLPPASCRALARRLEIKCLRGPRPGPHLAGLRQRVDTSNDSGAADLLARVEACLQPLERLSRAVVAAPASLLEALVASAEALAATDRHAGPARLWAGEAGEALAETLAPALDAAALLPDQPPDTLSGLLDAILAGGVVRAGPGGRGDPHPRIAIWGLLEARLQTADVIVLGGLAETVWPQATDPGPWMSRPMRARARLPSPEERIGQDAHDFVAAACAAPRVVLSCPLRRDGAPAVPARWLERLDVLLAGGRAIPHHPASDWARLLDQPEGAPQPAKPPRPAPPVARRPRALSVTEIETWLRDPYAIYARHVLKLRQLDALDEATDHADYGSLVHAALHRFLRDHGPAWPDDADRLLRAAMDRALAESRVRPALAAWWQPRLARIADWIVATEIERRRERAPVALVSEVAGKWVIARPGGDFTLTGRADRIERYADNTLTIIDYKTGTPPSDKDVSDGCSPQLTLEARMAAEGAFPGFAEEVAALAYWHITGGRVAGEQRLLFKGVREDVASAVETAAARLFRRIDQFDDPTTCYLSHPHPKHQPKYPEFAQLARVAEWSAGDDS
jgi:ATP-dependent helicase/nuclease subunit B